MWQRGRGGSGGGGLGSRFDGGLGSGFGGSRFGFHIGRHQLLFDGGSMQRHPSLRRHNRWLSSFSLLLLLLLLLYTLHLLLALLLWCFPSFHRRGGGRRGCFGFIFVTVAQNADVTSGPRVSAHTTGKTTTGVVGHNTGGQRCGLQG